MKHPLLATQRLVLRPISWIDENELFKLQNDQKNRRFLDNAPVTSSYHTRKFIEKILEGYAENKWFYWALSLDGKMIGTICLWHFSDNKESAEVGYELSQIKQGNGYMTEALGAVVKYAGEKLKMKTISAYTNPDNKASLALLTRKNFVYLKSKKADEHEKEKVVYTLNFDSNGN